MIYIDQSEIITGLGSTLGMNYGSVIAGKSALKKEIYRDQSYYFSRIDWNSADCEWNSTGNYSRLEKIIILSVKKVLSKSAVDVSSPGTVFVVSSTKGNIEDFAYKAADFSGKRIRLWEMARAVSTFFSNPNEPVVVCNACVSGLSAVITAKMLLESGKYDSAVVCGGDLISDFIVSGFSAFKALSSDACRPFDSARCGLNPGEAAAAVIIRKEDYVKPGNVYIAGCGTANDANHISGPCRNGTGLANAIISALSEAGMRSSEVDSVSAHGTGTIYNDEMESIAFEKCGLVNVPVFSLKGNWGHTMGAAGLIELAVSAEAMKNNIILPSANYSEKGVSGNIKISQKAVEDRNKVCLKTASGFGGCNAGVVLKKHE